MDVSKKLRPSKKKPWSFFQPFRVQHSHFLSLLSSERLRAASTVEPWNQTKEGLCPCGSERWSRPGCDLPSISGLKNPAEGRCTSSGQWVLADGCPHLTAGPQFCSLWLKLKARVCSQQNFTVNRRWTNLSHDLKSRSLQFYWRGCFRFLAAPWAGLRSYEFQFPAWKAEDSVSFLKAAWFYKVQIFVKLSALTVWVSERRNHKYVSGLWSEFKPVN